LSHLIAYNAKKNATEWTGDKSHHKMARSPANATTLGGENCWLILKGGDGTREQKSPEISSPLLIIPPIITLRPNIIYSSKGNILANSAANGLVDISGV
jgi:hypothetical protein